MSRIEQTFTSLRKTGNKAVVVYLTAGDPNLATTHDIVLGLDAAGADVVEIGRDA